MNHNARQKRIGTWQDGRPKIPHESSSTISISREQACIGSYNPAIFAIKGRDFKNPIALIIGQTDDIYALVQDVPEVAQKLMAAFWPGALTIVFSASASVSTLLTAGSGKIGLRVSSHPGAQGIVQKLKRPLTATSANLSGAPECASASDVALQLGDKIDAIIDLGDTHGTKGSTIIDVTTTPAVILREGAISRKIIGKYTEVI